MPIYKAEQVRQIYIDAKNTKELRLERITTAIMNYATSNPDKREMLLQTSNAKDNSHPSKSDINWVLTSNGTTEMKFLGYNVESERVMWSRPDRMSDPAEFDARITW